MKVFCSLVLFLVVAVPTWAQDRKPLPPEFTEIFDSMSRTDKASERSDLAHKAIEKINLRRDYSAGIQALQKLADLEPKEGLKALLKEYENGYAPERFCGYRAFEYFPQTKESIKVLLKGADGDWAYTEGIPRI